MDERRMDCPTCGEPCCRDEVDVGVGVICGPWGCMCGWSEDSYYDRSSGTSQAELDHPDHYVDSRGGLTPHKRLREKLNHFGLDGEGIVNGLFRGGEGIDDHRL